MPVLVVLSLGLAGVASFLAFGATDEAAVGSYLGFWGLLLVADFGLWVWQIYDAYNSCLPTRPRNVRRRRR